MIEGKRMEHLEDDKRENGSENGGEKLEGKRREERKKEKQRRRMERGEIKRQKMDIKVTEAWGEREVMMIGKRMEHLEDDKREKGSKNGGRSLKERG